LAKDFAKDRECIAEMPVMSGAPEKKDLDGRGRTGSPCKLQDCRLRASREMSLLGLRAAASSCTNFLKFGIGSDAQTSKWIKLNVRNALSWQAKPNN
jgi:hypothetical protein